MARRTSCPVTFRVLVYALALVATVSNSGCSGGKPKASDLAGTWTASGRPATNPSETLTDQNTNDMWASMVLTVDADGKFRSTQRMLGAKMTTAGTWSVSDHALALHVQEQGGDVKVTENGSFVGRMIEMTVSDDGTRLTFRRPGTDAEFTYERKQ